MQARVFRGSNGIKWHTHPGIHDMLEDVKLYVFG